MIKIARQFNPKKYTQTLMTAIVLCIIQSFFLFADSSSTINNAGILGLLATQQLLLFANYFQIWLNYHIAIANNEQQQFFYQRVWWRLYVMIVSINLLMLGLVGVFNSSIVAVLLLGLLGHAIIVYDMWITNIKRIYHLSEGWLTMILTIALTGIWIYMIVTSNWYYIVAFLLILLLKALVTDKLIQKQTKKHS